ncbi:DUF2304 domain-containing protein [Candidatus Allofournierella merdipullorum]|uniref:DUF2304 domain-containing protein n=1 Tax=Candidatus Allofournierella merdipullorum TaxID=2838595 RepID=UPI002A88588E|nr:DUF2304 domain-containing protein [Candidatus Fournierella merdipullorum]
MNDLLYPLLAVGDLVFLFLIFLFVKRGRLSVRFSLAWFALGGVLLVFAAFPLVAKMLRALLRFEVVSNMVFTMLLGFVLLVLLILSATASTQTEEIKRLTQHNAILEHRVRQLEEALKTREAEGSAEKPSDSR